MALFLAYSILILIAFFSFIVALLVGASALAIFFTRVPFAPTPKKNVQLIIDQFELRPSQIFYDLGCGDGRFLIEAEKRRAKATGFEISAWAFLRAWLNLKINHSQAKVEFKNFYQVNLARADAVFCFLIDSVMTKVEKKLKQELKSGAKVVCYGFNLLSWPPKKVIELKPGNPKSSKIFLYQK